MRSITDLYLLSIKLLRRLMLRLKQRCICSLVTTVCSSMRNCKTLLLSSFCTFINIDHISVHAHITVIIDTETIDTIVVIAAAVVVVFITNNIIRAVAIA